MSKVLKAVVIVRDDISSTMTWSGIPNHIIKILKDYSVSVTVIDKLGYPTSFSWRLKRLLHKAFRTQLPKYYSLETSKYYAKLLNQRLENLQDDFDFILAIDFTEGMPFFKSKKPIFVFRDASYLQLNELKYPGYENFTEDECRHIQEVEYQGFESCNKVLMTSQWSIDYCKKFYPDIASEKFAVLPFSAQVYPPPSREDWNLRSIKEGGDVKFLFVGRDWNRKGGPKAINIIRELNQLGVKVSLTIVGGCPDISKESFDIELIENLDMNRADDREQMVELYKSAHFFILPVNIEAFGIVFSEAMSFGLPVITHNTCALPEIMVDQKHGICLDKKVSAAVFASRIKNMIQDKNGYESMQEACFIRFTENYHPKSWVERLLSFVQ